MIMAKSLNPIVIKVKKEMQLSHVNILTLDAKMAGFVQAYKPEENYICWKMTFVVSPSVIHSPDLYGAC